MIRTTLASVAVAVMAGSAFAADYNFPSQAIPGNVPAKDVKQYVSFIWDDNGYSGELGTGYETKPGLNAYTDYGFVGGYVRDWSTDAWKIKQDLTKNPTKIDEGGMGLSWARITLGGAAKPDANAPQEWNAAATYQAKLKVVYNGHIWESTGYMEIGKKPGDASLPTWATWKDLGPVVAGDLTKKNPDGSPIGMTFNMISGLFVPAWGPGWQERESSYGFYTDQAANPYVAEKSGHVKIAISWGREAKYGTKAIPDRDGTDFMVQGVKKLVAAGHEIGNHTIDHIETNSPLPKAIWPNGGDGFDDGSSGKDALGNPWSEVEEFGGNPLGYQQKCGWKNKAGMALQKDTWKGIIALGEADGPKVGIDEKLVSFRAPRLEVNSSMFYALSEKGYLYDCGNEEGYELYRDGTDFVWPYTMDNGNPNSYTQKMSGETVISDSLPNGLWQYPVNCMIVPEGIRGAVYDQYAKIALAEDPTFVSTPKEWDGRVTGFDFNMFILWSMSGDQVLQTLKNTLDLRMAGNKAPMQIGCHTDYFTPIYDNATLLSEANKDTYGLCLKYNTWSDRKKSFEDFVTYGLSKGAYFKTGKETIDYVKTLVAKGSVGSKEVAFAPTEWTFDGDYAQSTAPTVANLESAKVEFDKNESAWGGYMADVDNGADLKGMTHVSLDYKTNVPLILSMYYTVGTTDVRRDVLLNNLSRNVNSGKIPVQAFVDFADGADAAMDPTTLSGIAVYPQTNGLAAVNSQFSVKNIKFFTGAVSGLANSAKTAVASLAVNGIANGKLNLTVNRAGDYSVNVFGVNGRLVTSIDRATLASGATSLTLGNMPAGMYVLKIKGDAGTVVAKAMVR